MLQEIRTKLSDKDKNTTELYTRLVEGKFDMISSDNMEHLALILIIIHDGMRVSRTAQVFSLSLEASRKILVGVLEDCHLIRQSNHYHMRNKICVMTVAIVHAILGHIETFCDGAKEGDVLPPSLIAATIQISRPHLRIYLSKPRLRDGVRHFVNTKTKFWKLYGHDLKRAGEVLKLDRLLPIFYCFPEEKVNEKILLGLYESILKMPMNVDTDAGVKLLGVTRDRKQIEYAHWKDIFDPQERGKHLTSKQKNGIRMSIKELETSQGRAQRLFDSFLLWTIQKQPDERCRHRLTVKHLIVWQNLAFRALRYEGRATVQRWGATQLSHIAQAIINNFIELFGKLQSDPETRKLSSYPIYRHEGVDWAHLIEYLHMMEESDDDDIKQALQNMIYEENMFAPLINFVVWLERDCVVNAFLLSASNDEYVVKATEPFYQKLGRLDRLVSGVKLLQHRVETCLLEAGVKRTSVVSISTKKSPLLNLLDNKSSESKDFNVLGASEMLGLWKSAINAKRIDERRALLDCIAILSPSCTSDVSTEFLCAIGNVVHDNVDLVVELLNSFRSRPPYGGGVSLKILMALIDITFTAAMLAKRDQLVVMSLIDFFIHCIDDEEIRINVVSNLTSRCAEIIRKCNDSRSLHLVPFILYRFLKLRSIELKDTSSLMLSVSNLTARLVSSSSKDTHDLDSNILENFLSLLSCLIVKSRDYSTATIELIGVAVKSSSRLSCALLRWISGTSSGRELLSCPESVNQVLGMTSTRLKDKSQTSEEMCKALWSTWYVTFVQVAVKLQLILLDLKHGTIISVKQEPFEMYLDSTSTTKTSVGSDLWHFAVQQETLPLQVSSEAAKLLVTLSAGFSGSNLKLLSTRIVAALRVNKDSVSGLLDMVTMILSKASAKNSSTLRASQLQQKEMLVRDFLSLLELDASDVSFISSFSPHHGGSPQHLMETNKPRVSPPPIPKPRHLTTLKDDIDDSVKRLLQKQSQVETYIYSRSKQDCMTYSVVVTHPNTSTIIRPGQKYRIRWQMTSQAEEAYCDQRSVEIILTRNMDEDMKKMTTKFRNDGYSVQYAKQCARLLCSQICNTCRQYIAVTTPLRPVKGSPHGFFDWIVPTDCPEGNYFVSLRTTDFNNAKSQGRVEWTKETTGPDAKCFLVRKATLLSESEVADDYNIQEHISDNYRISVPKATMTMVANSFIADKMLHESILDLLMKSEGMSNAVMSKLWKLCFLLKMFTNREPNLILRNLFSEKETKLRSVYMWELCVSLLCKNEEKNEEKVKYPPRFLFCFSSLTNFCHFHKHAHTDLGTYSRRSKGTGYDSSTHTQGIQ